MKSEKTLSKLRKLSSVSSKMNQQAISKATFAHFTYYELKLEEKSLRQQGLNAHGDNRQISHLVETIFSPTNNQNVFQLEEKCLFDTYW